MDRLFPVLLIIALAMSAAHAYDGAQKATGYRGIWYFNQTSGDEYVYKYSGGLGTYCAKHLPLAVYAPEVNRTFFVYGGTKGLGVKAPLLVMISYFDHTTGTVPRPTIVADKATEDAHENPTLLIDGDGHLWVYASSHGGKGQIYRSKEPYSIEDFDLVLERVFTYPQPRWIDPAGHVFLYTRYGDGRELYMNTSRDGITWSPERKIVGFGGHYQVSDNRGPVVGTAFNWHPPTGGLNARTNLYYIQSTDFGETWTNAAGKVLETPLSSKDNDAMVRDYQADGWLVYVKDITFDVQDRPIILYVLGRGYESGPKFGERLWMTARFNGQSWDLRQMTTGDHNYDTGSIYIEEDGAWRVIAPTDPGAQPWTTGGDMVMWLSKDQGKNWERIRTLGTGGPYNSTYARRPVNAHPGFYAFWADGHTLKPSTSSLYFTNKEGTGVWRLPRMMSGDTARPQLVSGEE